MFSVFIVVSLFFSFTMSYIFLLNKALESSDHPSSQSKPESQTPNV